MGEMNVAAWAFTFAGVLGIAGFVLCLMLFLKESKIEDKNLKEMKEILKKVKELEQLMK